MNVERTIHHESITLSKRSSLLPVLDVVLKTTTTYFESKDLPVNQQGIVPLPATDSHLLSILSKYNMTSLLVSIASSSSSSMQMVHGGLPVGTLIRYRNDTLLTEEPHDYHHIGPSPKDQMSLLKILSHHGLMCHNIQQEPFRNGNMHALLNHYDNTVVLMLPNDAYSLCHSKTLMEQIINVSPCRDFYGIYSQFDANLNHEQVTDKASWVKIEKVPSETRTNSAQDNDHGSAYSIERAIAFRFWPYEQQGEKLTLASILGGHGDYKMQACPLSKTSVLRVQQGTQVLQEQDFTNSALDMNQDIPMYLFQDEEDGHLKIERRIQRNNGISHKGRLFTKVYYDGSSRKCSNDLIHFTLVDVYPTIVLPLFHSLRIYLVEDSQPVILPNVTNTQYLNIQELNHTLSIRDHGLSSLTLNHQLPLNASLFVEMEYLPKFPSFESFPADPNRGFDIPPSFVTYICPMTNISTGTTQPQMVFSNALLVMPPVPDLSMPYNVISITSTFFALIIGTIINVTIKRANQSLKDQYNGVTRKRGIIKLKDFIVRTTYMLKRKRNALIQSSDCHPTSSHDKTD